MDFPNYPNKYKENSVVRAKDFWAYKKQIRKIPDIKPPKDLIMCYSPTLFEHIKNEYNAKFIPDVFGVYFYIIEENESQIGICGGFGIGAPIAAILIEELSVFGIKNFISIGVAGCLQKDIELGTMIVCDKAIRDEGVSHHYIKKDKFAYPSQILTDKVINILKNRDQRYKIGGSWTIDAPYRETLPELVKYRNEGILTVEMEAAAIFAVTKYLNLNSSAIFTISDYLTEDGWELHFHRTEKHLQNLFLIAKETIVSL